MLSWISRFLRWLSQARLAAFTFAVVVVAIWTSFAMHSEPAVRLAGLFLQLLGIVAAALGIRDTRRMFDKPSFLQLLRNWATSWPRLRPKVRYVPASGTALVEASTSLTVWHDVEPSATLEQRIDALEANLKSIEGRLSSSEHTIYANERAFTSKLQQESQERGTQVAELHRKVEAASTDGLRLAAAGAFWLTVGVVLSSASPELLALSG